MSQTELIKSIHKKLEEFDRTVIVSIDGPAGAGKTTLAKALSLEFPESVTIHMDDLYRGWLLTLGPTLTRELQSILEQLNEENKVTYSKFDWEQNLIGESVTFEGPKLLILEGVGAGQGAIAEQVDVKAWVEIPTQVGLERVLARDGHEIAAEMELFILDQEAHFTAEQTRERADFHIPGN